MTDSETQEKSEVPTSNLGQLRSQKLILTTPIEEEHIPLTRQDEEDQWENTISNYHDFIHGTRSLESHYVRLKTTRNWYYICSGTIIWFTIVILVLILPLTVPLGWDNVSKSFGWTLMVLSFELGCLSFIPMAISCLIGRQKRLPNPFYFFPSHAELALLALMLLATSFFLLAHGHNSDINGPAFMAFIILLVLCGLIAGRIIILETPDPKTYLTLIALLVISLVGYYLALEGILHGTHWWTSFLGPSIVLAIFCLVAALQYCRLTIRHVRVPDGTILPWGFSFRKRFIAAVEKGPFLVGARKSSTPQFRKEGNKSGELSQLATIELTRKDFELKKQRSLRRIERYRQHLPFLRALHHGYLIGVIGWMMLAVGIIFGGLYVSRHYSRIPQHSITVRETKLFEVLSTTAAVLRNATKAQPGEALTTRKKRIDVRKKQLLKRRAQEMPINIDSYIQKSDILTIGYSENRRSNSKRLSTLQITDQPSETLETQSDSKTEQKRIVEQEAPGGFLRAIITTEHLVGSGVSWWVSVLTLVLGLTLLTQSMVNIFGSWMEYLAFAFLDATNRNVTIDLNLPDGNLNDPSLLGVDVPEKAKNVLKILEENAFDIFMNPTFEGLTLPPKEEQDHTPP